jgi:UDP-N-acetylmuramoyl-tripeptide--D-alanyl-D-alanine ligase
MFKNYVQRKLENYVQQYLIAHPDIKLVCVAGSVGKTSTKLAIATVLSQQYRVRLHEGNHNASLSAPLAILGIEYPGSIRNPLAWWSVFRAAKQKVREPASDVDVIIQELGTDRPGELPDFGRYLNPDIGVITGVTAEHMEFFGTLDAVAAEELSLANFSKIAIINRDDIDDRYAQLIANPNISTYGTSGLAEYSYEVTDMTLGEGYQGLFTIPELPDGLPAKLFVLGEHAIRPISAAVTVAIRFGMAPEAITQGVELIRPVHGRMNILRGVQDTILIDDTYNSSPAAAEMAIRTLDTLQAPQKIAVLGSMNELGATSAEAHRYIGSLCHPSSVQYVVTVGKEAMDYLAPAAAHNGCAVKSFPDALSAGAYVRKIIEPRAIVLLKGSQGGIFVEEATKMLLHSTSDDAQLVRQEPEWLEAKSQFFSKF